MGTKATLPRAGKGVSANEQSDTNGVIRRGPLAGLPRRPKANPRRHLTEPQVKSVINAAAYSETLSMSELMVTGIDILWRHAACVIDEHGKVQPERMPGQMQRLLERVRKEMRRLGHRFHWIFVWENGKTKKEHCHVLWNVPVHLIHHMDKMIRRNFGFYDPNGIQWRTGGRKNAQGRDTGYGLRSRAMRRARLTYMVATLDPSNFRYYGFTPERICDLLGGVRAKGDDGIPWRRYGMSRSLSKAARRKAGWKDLREWETLAMHLHCRPKAVQGTALVGRHHVDRQRAGSPPRVNAARSAAGRRLQSARGRSR